MKNLIFLGLGLFFFGCQSETSEHKTYISGEIIHPTADYVLLMQHDKVIDSLPLQPNNTFSKNYTDLKEGLYFFKHGQEFQYLYIQPTDSINIRLNTWDFDESLVFDGKGAEKSDFLLQIFRINEQEMNNFYAYFPLSEQDFEQKYQDVFNRNRKVFQMFKKNNPNVSNHFLHLAESSLNYQTNRFKELYPYYHHKITDTVVKVSNDFYNFRENINFNDAILEDYYVYQNYLMSYIYNEAYIENNYNTSDSIFRNKVVNLISEKIENKTLKNRLLYQEMLNNIFEKNLSNTEINTFYEHCTDSVMTQKVREILRLKNNTDIDKMLPNLLVTNVNSQKITINKLMNNRPTVIYFVSNLDESFTYISHRLKYLRKNFPTIKFIGIFDAKFQPNLKQINSLPKNEIFFANPSTQNLFHPDFTRVIIINRNGKLVNRFSLIRDTHLEKTLENIAPKKSVIEY